MRSIGSPERLGDQDGIVSQGRVQLPQHRPVVRSTGRYGDSHVYYGWYGGSIWQYTKMDEPFVSELGATALPNYESLVRFLPDHWPIRGHERDWVFHKLQIPEAMRAWGDPGNLTLKEYIPRTQAYVARLFQIALERARRQKPRTGGILHFHAIDIWPSVTMAAMPRRFWLASSQGQNLKMISAGAS